MANGIKDKVGKLSDRHTQQQDEQDEPIQEKGGGDYFPYKYVPKKTKTFNWQGFFSFLAVIGAIGVGAVGYLAWTSDNTGLLTIFTIFGGGFFFPLGAILGTFLLDPQKRAKLMRSVLRKNYGLIGFLSRGKQIKYLIKDLDHDLLWLKNQVWLIHDNAIYWQDKNHAEGKVDLDANNFYQTGGVPTLFVDIDNVTPRVFNNDESAIKPEELGSGTQSYIANEKAKALMVKRTLQITGMLTLIAAGVAALFGFLTWDLANNQGVICREVANQVTQGGG